MEYLSKSCVGYFFEYIFIKGTNVTFNVVKVKNLACEMYEQHFRAAQAKPRGVVAKLCNIVVQLENACEKHSSSLKVFTSAAYNSIIIENILQYSISV